MAEKLTVKDLQQMKADGKKIVAAVVYEAQMAAMIKTDMDRWGGYVKLAKIEPQ